MIRYHFTSFRLSFWASPYESMSAIAKWGAIRSERNSLAIQPVDPDILWNADPGAPPSRPLPDFPTDVPAPEPHDVPVPEPMDPPVRDPGKPPDSDPEKQPNPKRRPVP